MKRGVCGEGEEVMVCEEDGEVMVCEEGGEVIVCGGWEVKVCEMMGMMFSVEVVWDVREVVMG